MNKLRNKTTRSSEKVDRVAIQLKDIGVTFERENDSLEAIKSVSAEVKVGEFVSLIGHSGCGKSTLLRVIADIIRPSRGSVKIFNKEPSEARLKRHFSMVFQKSVLLPWATVMENILLPFEIGQNIKQTDVAMDPKEALELVQLSGFEDARPSELSGGMQQRVSIARALITRPRILLMDEPFGALDELVRDTLNVELLRIWKQSGMTVVFVTHSLQEAAFISQRVFVMGRRPSVISNILEINLPDDRPIELKDSPEMGEHVAQLRGMLNEG